MKGANNLQFQKQFNQLTLSLNCLAIYSNRQEQPQTDFWKEAYKKLNQGF